MTNNNDFEDHLDAHPDDWEYRLIYADWLEEQVNPRAESMRWMVENHHEFILNEYTQLEIPWTIHVYGFIRICKWLNGISFNTRFNNTFDYPTRIAAEIDLHNALVKAGEIHCALIEEVEA